MAAPAVGRLLALAGGGVCLLVAFVPPLEPLADRFLWAHMLQHDLIIFAAAPLLVAAVGPFAARRLGGVARGALAWLTRPAVALVVSTVALWAWHLPAAYDLALEHDAVHVLEHVCFLVAFAVFWWPLLIPAAPPFRPLAGDGSRVAYLLTGAMQGSVLAGLITFAGRVVYPYYLGVPHAETLSVLADQQLAGALMLFPGAVVYAAAALVAIRGEAA